ncbi:MAG TPA: protein translocase subunit SecD [Kofleriaceae bacterium]|nr:protein translocase subunit SecD [Kofleriaceae bacterium]
MDRSLRWRTIGLVFLTLFCLATLAPSFMDRSSLPSVWPLNHLFGSQINLGLDLQGGKHIVYNIALDKAVADKASEIMRDLDAELADQKIKAVVKAPSIPLGSVVVLLDKADDAATVAKDVVDNYHNDVDKVPCQAEAGEKAEDAAKKVCFIVSSDYAEGIKKSALTNAVSTIRERINESGVAEPSVVEKGDDIIVELPGDPNSDSVKNTEALIARTAKLEMKIVDDCSTPSPQGCTAASSAHDGSPYMKNLYKHLAPDKEGNVTEPDAKALGIKAEIASWQPEEGGGRHTDYYLIGYDREESVPLTWAKKHNKLTKDSKIEGDHVKVLINGWELIERYLNGDKELGVVGQIEKDPSLKVPDDHELAYEPVEPPADAPDKRKFWRSYYLEKAVRLTGTAIQNAMGSYDPNTNRPIVLLDFNRFGGRVFGDITSQIVGMEFATLLDGKVRSAPQINQAIRGGRASITMGGSDPVRQEKERDDLVNVLKTGSLPAPLVEASESNLGPTLGRDAIDKTRNSFIIGILLVIAIMVGIYRWSGGIAVFAVVFHIIMTLAVMALFGATLTLPGIAAIVLSIGMEVDGNILIYERIRDELLLGKSVRGAIDLGFSRAFSAILDGQLTTAAAGWVLLQYGSGPIKGFAVMLLVGVFTTLTTNIWVTRIFFDWAVARKKGTLQTLSI